MTSSNTAIALCGQCAVRRSRLWLRPRRPKCNAMQINRSASSRACSPAKLTTKEAAKLEKSEAHIEKMEQRAGSQRQAERCGEAAHRAGAEQAESQEIYRDKHNRADRQPELRVIATHASGRSATSISSSGSSRASNPANSPIARSATRRKGRRTSAGRKRRGRQWPHQCQRAAEHPGGRESPEPQDPQKKKHNARER